MGPAGVFALAALVAAAAPIDLKPMDRSGYRSLLASQRGKLQGKRFVLVTISADQPESRKAAADFLTEHGLQPPAYLLQVPDQDAFIASVSPQWSGALPALFLYDASGRLARSFLGETKIETIEREIARLLNLRPVVQVPQARPSTSGGSTTTCS